MNVRLALFMWLLPIAALIPNGCAPVHHVAVAHPVRIAPRPHGIPTSSPMSSHPTVHAAATPMPPSCEILIRPEVAAIVERLAAAHSITSRAVGAGGRASPSWQAYSDLVDIARPSELTALLAHPSPVVRGYVAQHIAIFVPSERHAVAPLLADDTVVSTEYGCSGGDMPIAMLVVSALCESSEGRDMLHDALVNARTIAPTRAAALACMVRWNDPERRRFALAALEDSDARVRTSALITLETSAGPQDAARIATHASDPDDGVRLNAMRTLARLQSPVSRETAERTVHDPDPRMASEAARTYSAQDDASIEVVRRLLEDRTTRDGAIAGLARRGTPESFALIEPYLHSSNDDDDESRFVADAVRELFDALPSVTRTMVVRRILRGDFDEIRSDAIEYLERANATDAAAEVRRFIVPGGPHLIAAIRAAMAFQDSEAIPALIRVLASARLEPVFAIGRALVVFHATAAIPALRHAVRRQP